MARSITTDARTARPRAVRRATASVAALALLPVAALALTACGDDDSDDPDPLAPTESVFGTVAPEDNQQNSVSNNDTPLDQSEVTTP